MTARTLARFASLTALAASTAPLLAQSTAFTFQGELKQGAGLASGLFDFQFRLFSAASGGSQLGSTQCLDNVSVVDGRFSVAIDFGQQFDVPSSRFLAIEVRPDTGLACPNTTGYTALSPRQLITAAPIANHAKSAFALDAADGSPANAVFVDTSGRVGIGTTSPLELLHLVGNEAALRLQDDSDPASFTLLEAFQPGQMRLNNVASAATSLIDINPQVLNATSNANVRFFRETNTTGTKSVIFHSGNNSTATSAVIGVGGSSSAFQLDGGNLGIGIAAPNVPLHIARDLDAVLVLQDIGPNSTQSGYIGFWNASRVETGWIGYGTPGSPHMTMLNNRAGGDIILRPGPGRAVQVPVLEITGADLAEKFPASETLEPGMVVAIDAKNAGKLCLSRSAYNRCVAGVVSGANNFAAGAILGNLPGHEDAPAIALSGRVYVYCDASAVAIEPGDLLTTSDTPGHAMKASNADLANGAVLGKAMGRLPVGQRGLVLVLVNLQ
ncbi:MAG: hypothetical protein SFZ23_05800 [Planctomycetota bacterium]|nr:hypothetical protein [Planctomycetota bacterium]